MVQTRRQRAGLGNSQPPQPAPQQPAPQQTASIKRAPKNQSQGGNTKKGGKKAKAIPEEDEDAVDDEEVEEEEADDDDAPPARKPGKKRKTPAVNEGPSSKARKTGAGRRGTRNATGSASPTADAANEDQPPAPKKGKGNGKGKGKANEADVAAAAANEWFEVADGTQNHVEASKSAQKFQDARIATIKNWSSHPPEYGSVIWKGGVGLGFGAFGAARAFYCEDEEGIITDRVAVKDTVLRRDNWLEWPRWWGAPWDIDNREHMEIKVMQDIADDAKANRCVFIRGSKRYDELYTYRIIMNYCPFGSMHSANPATPERLGPRKGKKTKDKPLDIYNDGLEVPESLVWKWFEDLAKACVLMEKGKDFPSDSVSRQSGQHTIVHRDIKPDNIFLEPPSKVDGDWPEYPVAILGDFGSAIYTNDDDEHNPMSYNFMEGTPGFKPLELCSMSDPETKRYKPMGKLGSATNIWSLGASLISICNRTSNPTTEFYSPEMSIPAFNENARHVYSKELRELLDACVRYRGNDRIGAQDLLDSISRLTAGTGATPGVADLANGMRAGKHRSADDEPGWQPSIKERYRLAMSYEDGEALRVAEEQADDDKEKEEKERRKQEAVDAADAEKQAKKDAAAAKKKKKGKK